MRREVWSTVCRPLAWKDLRVEWVPEDMLEKCQGLGAVAQSPGREAALAWASLAQRFPASSVLAREGAGCGSVGLVSSSAVPSH